jgi:hypothetical protein
MYYADIRRFDGTDQKWKKTKNKMKANLNDKTMSSVKAQGPYPLVNTSFDPP